MNLSWLKKINMKLTCTDRLAFDENQNWISGASGRLLRLCFYFARAPCSPCRLRRLCRASFSCLYVAAKVCAFRTVSASSSSPGKLSTGIFCYSETGLNDGAFTFSTFWLFGGGVCGGGGFGAWWKSSRPRFWLLLYRTGFPDKYCPRWCPSIFDNLWTSKLSKVAYFQKMKQA